MVEPALRNFAKQNFAKDGDYYPIYQGETSEIQMLALMVKGERNVLLRPFKKDELTILAELATFIEGSKRKELQDALSREIRTEKHASLVLKNDDDDDDDDDEDDDEPRR